MLSKPAKEEIEGILIVSTNRKKEALKNAQFLIENTSIPFSLFSAAANSANRNPFHDFGHQLAAAVAGYRIATAEGLSQAEAAEIVCILIFHDGGHEGHVQVDDEIRAFQRMCVAMNGPRVRMFTDRPFKEFMTIARDGIMATAFSQHGKMTGLRERIIQDADLSHLGQGPEPWLWASMGLVDELNRNRDTTLSQREFVRKEQEEFIKYLTSAGKNGTVWLTDGARKIFENPVETVKTLANYTDTQIDYAYIVRKIDVTVAEFTERLNLLVLA